MIKKTKKKKKKIFLSGFVIPTRVVMKLLTAKIFSVDSVLSVVKII